MIAMGYLGGGSWERVVAGESIGNQSGIPGPRGLVRVIRQGAGVKMNWQRLRGKLGKYQLR